jgi:hypothetical protein
MVIVSIALAIDVIVRSLVLNQEPHQYVDISLIWMATVLYVVIGTTAGGVEPLGTRSRAWLIVLVVALSNVAVSMLRDKAAPLLDLAGTAVGSLAGALLAIIILRSIYGAWERRTLGREPREE